MNLRAKMMIAFMGIVLVPTIALIFINDRMMAQSIRESYTHKGKDEIERTVNFTFDRLTNELSNYVSFAATDSTFNRAAYYLNSIDSEQDMIAVGEEFRQRLGLSFIEITDLDGKITYSTLPDRKGMSLAADATINSIRKGNRQTTRTDYDKMLRETLLHSAAKIVWSDGDIGYLHGGYILDEAFLRLIAGPDTILAIYFHGSATLRSTESLPLTQHEVDATVHHLMSQCLPSSNKNRPCEETVFHVWDDIDGHNPYLIVSSLFFIKNDIPIGVILTAEDANLMFRDTTNSRNNILLFGAAFALLGAALGYLASGFIVRPISKLTAELSRMADTDQLTGARNRRSMDIVFKMEINRAMRGGLSFATIILDVDHFKSINDRFGHMVGDEVLKYVSKTCNDTLRETDYCFRYGGEEFLLLLPIVYNLAPTQDERYNMDLKSALIVAERLRNAIRSHTLNLGGTTIQVTASFGVGVFPYHGETVEELIFSADEALYKAKNGGRDRCVVADEGARLRFSSTSNDTTNF